MATQQHLFLNACLHEARLGHGPEQAPDEHQLGYLKGMIAFMCAVQLSGSEVPCGVVDTQRGLKKMEQWPLTAVMREFLQNIVDHLHLRPTTGTPVGLKAGLTLRWGEPTPEAGPPGSSIRWPWKKCLTVSCAGVWLLEIRLTDDRVQICQNFTFPLSLGTLRTSMADINKCQAGSNQAGGFGDGFKTAAAALLQEEQEGAELRWTWIPPGGSDGECVVWEFFKERTPQQGSCAAQDVMKVHVSKKKSERQEAALPQMIQEIKCPGIYGATLEALKLFQVFWAPCGGGTAGMLLCEGSSFIGCPTCFETLPGSGHEGCPKEGWYIEGIHVGGFDDQPHGQTQPLICSISGHGSSSLLNGRDRNGVHHQPASHVAYQEVLKKLPPKELAQLLQPLTGPESRDNPLSNNLRQGCFTRLLYNHSNFFLSRLLGLKKKEDLDKHIFLDDASAEGWKRETQFLLQHLRKRPDLCTITCLQPGHHRQMFVNHMVDHERLQQLFRESKTDEEMSEEENNAQCRQQLELYKGLLQIFLPNTPCEVELHKALAVMVNPKLGGMLVFVVDQVVCVPRGKVTHRHAAAFLAALNEAALKGDTSCQLDLGMVLCLIKFEHTKDLTHQDIDKWGDKLQQARDRQHTPLQQQKLEQQQRLQEQQQRKLQQEQQQRKLEQEQQQKLEQEQQQQEQQRLQQQQEQLRQEKLEQGREGLEQQQLQERLGQQQKDLEQQQKGLEQQQKDLEQLRQELEGQRQKRQLEQRHQGLEQGRQKLQRHNGGQVQQPKPGGGMGHNQGGHPRNPDTIDANQPIGEGNPQEAVAGHVAKLQPLQPMAHRGQAQPELANKGSQPALGPVQLPQQLCVGLDALQLLWPQLAAEEDIDGGRAVVAAVEGGAVAVHAGDFFIIIIIIVRAPPLAA